MYFVTVCTRRRICLLGEVVDGLVVLSPAGLVVESWWHIIPGRFPGLLLDAMIVMPNHLHGLILINARPGTQRATTRPKLGAAIHWFRTKTTNDYGLGVWMSGWPPYPGKLWQPGYYEHIVRGDRGIERIRSYIEANPSQWAHDEDNPDRVNRVAPGR